MSEIAIVVAEVNWPAPGKKVGMIVDNTGKKWGAFPDKLQGFIVGNAYIIQEYSTFQAPNGQTLYTIKKARPAAAPPSYTPQTQQPIQYQAPVYLPQTPTPMPPPQPQPQVSATALPSSDNQRRLDIFVCGAFNHYMQNPNVEVSSLGTIEMIEILQRMKGAWMAVFGPAPLKTQAAPPKPTPPAPPQYNRPDMNDDIPFD